MAKFKYRMQNILDIKEKLESQAKMEYAQAKIRLNQEEDILDQLRQRKEQYETEGRELLIKNLVVQDIIENRGAIRSMDEIIYKQILQVTIAERNLEDKRIKLTNVMQERKSHETLKEKAFEGFLKDLNSQESKEIDELTSYRYGQKEDD
jgi:flagellar protein FliJ